MGLVFIIDDDRGLRESVSGLLDGEGYPCAGFADGIEALAALRTGLKPSVILLDIAMPRMDGWDFRNVQRADPAFKDVPVAVVTGAGFSEGTIRHQFGDVAVLRKPPPPGELLATVARLARRAAPSDGEN
ncbi:MAG TPA: response regulator [Polyangia bacterium]|jgi:CheY-like chemotaxis protein